MITTNTRTKKTQSLFHGGQRGRYPPSSTENFWMEEKASSFLGTRSTEKFTRKHWCIFLTQVRKARKARKAEAFSNTCNAAPNKCHRACQKKAGGYENTTAIRHK